jgi:hypothetical protein
VGSADHTGAAQNRAPDERIDITDAGREALWQARRDDARACTLGQGPKVSEVTPPEASS